MTRGELVNKYALDVSINTLERLDEIVRLENIDNDWNMDKYISLDTINSDIYQINFWEVDENILFLRCEDVKYFKMVCVEDVIDFIQDFYKSKKINLEQRNELLKSI